MQDQDYFEQEYVDPSIMDEDENSQIPHFLEGVIQALYGVGRLDKGDLDNCLSELCHITGVEFPDLELNIDRPSSTISDSLKGWIESTRKYNQKIKQDALGAS